MNKEHVLQDISGAIKAALKHIYSYIPKDPVIKDDMVVMDVSSRNNITREIQVSQIESTIKFMPLDEIYSSCKTNAPVMSIIIPKGNANLTLTRKYPDTYPFYFADDSGNSIFCIQQGHDDKGEKRAILYACHNTEPDYPLYEIRAATAELLPLRVVYSTNEPGPIFGSSQDDYCRLMANSIAEKLSAYLPIELHRKNHQELRIVSFYDTIAKSGIKNSDPENNPAHFEMSDESGRSIRYVVVTNDGRKMSLDGFMRITQPELWEAHKQAMRGKSQTKKNEFLIKTFFSKDDLVIMASDLFEKVASRFTEKEVNSLRFNTFVQEQLPLFNGLVNTNVITKDSVNNKAGTFNLSQFISVKFIEKERRDFFEKNKDHVIALTRKIPIVKEDLSFSEETISRIRGNLDNREDLIPIRNCPSDIISELIKLRIYSVAYYAKGIESSLFKENTDAINIVLGNVNPRLFNEYGAQKEIAIYKSFTDDRSP